MKTNTDISATQNRTEPHNLIKENVKFSRVEPVAAESMKREPRLAKDKAQVVVLTAAAETENSPDTDDSENRNFSSYGIKSQVFVKRKNKNDILCKAKNPDDSNIFELKSQTSAVSSGILPDRSGRTAKTVNNFTSKQHPLTSDTRSRSVNTSSSSLSQDVARLCKVFSQR